MTGDFTNSILDEWKQENNNIVVKTITALKKKLEEKGINIEFRKEKKGKYWINFNREVRILEDINGIRIINNRFEVIIKNHCLHIPLEESGVRIRSAFFFEPMPRQSLNKGSLFYSVK